MSITAKRPRWSKRWPLHRPFLSTLSEVLRFSVRPASVLPRKTDSSLFGVGRTARPVTASTVGARPIVQVGDRGNDAVAPTIRRRRAQLRTSPPRSPCFLHRPESPSDSALFRYPHQTARRRKTRLWPGVDEPGLSSRSHGDLRYGHLRHKSDGLHWPGFGAGFAVGAGRRDRAGRLPVGR